MKEQGFAVLGASQEAVGLEAGQVGNSEVGHLTIGAGRTLPSMSCRLREAYESGAWEQNPGWRGLVEAGVVHLVGLVSDAGVHGLARTLVHAAHLAHRVGVRDIVIHPILDGVDSRAGTAPTLLADVKKQLQGIPVQWGVVLGRKWFCDRSGNLELTRVAARALRGEGKLPRFSKERLAEHLVSESEMSFPAHCIEGGRPIADGEPVLITSNRADRARQIIQVLGETQTIYTIIDPGQGLEPEHVFFPLERLSEGLAYEFKKAGIRSTRIAEKCKFPHVTFFFNGFDAAAEGEGICLPSIAEHEIAAQPEMSLHAVTEQILGVLQNDDKRVVVANLCNLDQVGHLGRLDLALRAAAEVDASYARIAELCEKKGWSLIVTSDHGCADCVVGSDGAPFGSHTLKPVPFFARPAKGMRASWVSKEGTLANVAATCLGALGLAIPEGMESPLLRFQG